MSDDARSIENLLYLYAERIDAGDFAAVAELFARGCICSEFDGEVVEVARGRDAVQALYEATTKRHPDGTPRTKHVVTNPIIDVDGDAASCRSYFTVVQATPSVPLQPIAAGRYRDTFVRLDGAWHFETRTIYLDLVGNVSDHLLMPVPLG